MKDDECACSVGLAVIKRVSDKYGIAIKDRSDKAALIARAKLMLEHDAFVRDNPVRPGTSSSDGYALHQRLSDQNRRWAEAVLAGLPHPAWPWDMPETEMGE